MQMGVIYYSSSSSQDSVVSQFSQHRKLQHGMLERLGSTVAGRVYVYRREAFDWAKLLLRSGCIDPSQYTTYKHGGDLLFAHTMTSSSAPWVTRNASAATLFVVPSLLGLSSVCCKLALRCRSRRPVETLLLLHLICAHTFAAGCERREAAGGRARGRGAREAARGRRAGRTARARGAPREGAPRRASQSFSRPVSCWGPPWRASA